MQWLKKGLINLDSCLGQGWRFSHAAVPSPILLDDCIRVYVNFFDEKRIARVGYVDLDINNPSKVIDFSKEPLLDLGAPGTFDQDGVLQCSVVKLSDSQYYMYYVGFEVENKIRYRLLSGLAISNDGGKTFNRAKQTPILERTDKELFFRGGPFVVRDKDKFRLWYVAGSTWITLNDKEMPVYTLNYQESIDGIHWQDEGEIIIDPRNNDEYGFGRPYYFISNGKHYLFYSTRSKDHGYIIGYAKSNDGVNWQRDDANVGIHKSSSGFDSEMICYAAPIEVNGKVLMFYNGNDFGRDGFAYAELVSW